MAIDLGERVQHVTQPEDQGDSHIDASGIGECTESSYLLGANATGLFERERDPPLDQHFADLRHLCMPAESEGEIRPLAGQQALYRIVLTASET
jgi:hypothetical protein